MNNPESLTTKQKTNGETKYIIRYAKITIPKLFQLLILVSYEMIDTNSIVFQNKHFLIINLFIGFLRRLSLKKISGVIEIIYSIISL
jgi:hypothetical protein